MYWKAKVANAVDESPSNPKLDRWKALLARIQCLPPVKETIFPKLEIVKQAVK